MKSPHICTPAAVVELKRLVSWARDLAKNEDTVQFQLARAMEILIVSHEALREKAKKKGSK